MTLFRPDGPPGPGLVQGLDAGAGRRARGDRTRRRARCDATRAHTVVLGDSLASIANAEYGTPTMWRAIAIANGLEDPFNLRLGHELLLPTAADAAALA